MTERQFIRQRGAAWEAWDGWMKGAAWDEPFGGTPSELPSRYRALCLDLSLARDRGYSAPLQEALHQRVLAAHQRIYGERPRRPLAWLAFFAVGFPALVRREWRFVLAAAILLFVPLLAQLAIVQRAPNAVYLVLDPQRVGEAEAMYAPGAAHLGRPRQASTEWTMWGFYIANNVRIDFQCFAGGIAFGLGAVFFLLYNGLVIGALAGHLTRIGYIETFWGFVAGHSALELMGATLSGAAGLIIGVALIAPGRSSRAAALVARGGTAVQMLAGAATMTFLAAFVEAFWSPSRTVPLALKLTVGVVLWTLLVAYFMRAGRVRRAE
jgi:uncharacterized membrane protein SpoIIM required for sporulation